MAQGAALTCAKTVLFVFNFVFALAGMALVVCGVWFVFDHSTASYLRLVTITEEDPTAVYCFAGLITLGAFVLLIGLAGCCGAVTERRCLLITYLVMLVGVLLAEGATAVLIWLFNKRVEELLMLMMRDQLQDSYRSNTTTAHAWDYVQQNLECCGALGPGDWVDSDWYASSNARNGAMQELYVPWSCCRTEPIVYINWTNPNLTNRSACQNEASVEQYRPDYLNKKGCYEGLLMWLQNNALVLIVVCGVALCVQLVGVLVASYVMKAVHDEKRVGVGDCPSANGYPGASEKAAGHGDVEYC